MSADVQIGEVGVLFEWRGKMLVAVSRPGGCTGCIAKGQRQEMCQSLPSCDYKVFMTVEDAVTHKLTGKLPS